MTTVTLAVPHAVEAFLPIEVTTRQYEWVSLDAELTESEARSLRKAVAEAFDETGQEQFKI